MTLCIDNCSLLEQYPDLQVADSGRISNNPQRATTAQQGLHSPASDGQRTEWTVHQKPQDEPVSSVPDQGYLVMGPSEDVSLDVVGLEPMSNSVLNGMLDKQLEEFWMQHLTDNLARCNSHLGNSILHGLAQPPQPCGLRHGPNSLEPSLGEGSEDSNDKISYLSTHNLGPCSSNFSSPVLRISETENPHLQWHKFRWYTLEFGFTPIRNISGIKTIIFFISLYVLKAFVFLLDKWTCSHVPPAVRFCYYTLIVIFHTFL